MAIVALEREQREGIRSEIRVAASRSKDITKCLQPDRDGNTDRASVVREHHRAGAVGSDARRHRLARASRCAE